jgi:serine/threonine protein kinase/Flp pilus assembly protein TadD
VQEAYLEIAWRFPEYAAARPMPVFLWLRLLIGRRAENARAGHPGVGGKQAIPPSADAPERDPEHLAGRSGESAAMTDAGAGREPLEELVDDFVARSRRGERPSLSEYALKHPELADEIRDLFPALAALEDARPAEGGLDAAASAPPAGLPYQQLGEYRIVREIGRGGMGVVYEAVQESLGRRVALKVLPLGGAVHPIQVERFQREARAAARLHHTNIVPVFGVGEDGGTSFYVMQYIEGRPLNEVLAELRRLRDKPASEGAPSAAGGEASSPDVARSLWNGRFRTVSGSGPPDAGNPVPATRPDNAAAPPPAPSAKAPSASGSSGLLSDPHRPYAKGVAHIGVQAADALEYAAGQGVLHRDVKPSNLLLDVFGTVWLTDFGLAKATGTPDLTRTGDLLGTLRYLAPERLEGRADVRSDVYALGLTLYELLALQPAFGGADQAELLRRITEAEAARLDRINPQLPRDLVTIVHKAMAREPADRYQTAGALAEDLRRFLDDRSIVARRASLVEQAWRLCRRNPTMVALLTTLAALLLLAAGGGLWFEWQRAERQGRAREAIEAALKEIPGLQRQGRWSEARAVLTQANSRRDDAGSDDLRRRLARVERDVTLAVELERIRLQWATELDRFGYRVADRDYAAAFEKAGLAVDDEEATAARIRASPIREQLLGALDGWALSTDDEALRTRLLRLARLTDPDPEWGDRLRDPASWGDAQALERLAAAAPLDASSPQLLTALGARLQQAGADAEQFLRAAQRRHPEDFWLNCELGTLLRRSRPADAVGFLRAAAATRPDSSEVYSRLGLALDAQGRTEEALAAYRKAVDLDPNNPGAQSNLANDLADTDQLDEAIAACRRAIAVDPTGALAHANLGYLLRKKGRLDEATAECRLALHLDPKQAVAHYNLGLCLEVQCQWDEAVAEYRLAIELDPSGAPAHHELGWCMHAQGRWDEAMGEYRRAIDLDPKLSSPHQNIGIILRSRGKREEALAEFRKAAELDPAAEISQEALVDGLLRCGRFAEARTAAQHGLDTVPADKPLRPNLRQKVELCDRMLALDAKAAAILQGQEEPGDPAQQLEAARLCMDYGRPYAAARFYAGALAAQPALADDLASSNRYDAAELARGNRYDAACAAARAAAEPNSDETRLSVAERTRLRGQALEWLRADLAKRAELQKGGTSEGGALVIWRKNPDLAGVRDPAPLAALPDEERRQWEHFWADAAALLAADALEQGRACAARREWGQAAECYARQLERHPADGGHIWFEYAAVLLLSGDREGYSRACAHMVEKCCQAQDLRAYHVARACTLAPDSVADAGRPERLFMADPESNRGEFWSLTELGALDYRAGRYEDAAPLFEQSLRAERLGGRAVLNWLWLALTEHRLGRPEQARRWLTRAQAWLDQYGDGMPSRADEELGLHLHNWLEAHVLRREAEALLGLADEAGRQAGPPAGREKK